MKVAMIAEGEEIEFETLALNHTLGGQIHDAYLGKVRLTGDGTERGELRTIELHPVVVLRVLVLKGLQYRRIIVGAVFRLSAQHLQTFVFSCFF
jgi:hypothetical protein